MGEPDDSVVEEEYHLSQTVLDYHMYTGSTSVCAHTCALSKSKKKKKQCVLYTPFLF